MTTWKTRFLSNYFVNKWIMLCFVDHWSFVLFFWPLCCLFFFHLRILIKPFCIFKIFFCVENFISKIIKIQSAALYLIVTSLQRNDESGFLFIYIFCQTTLTFPVYSWLYKTTVKAECEKCKLYIYKESVENSSHFLYSQILNSFLIMPKDIIRYQ